MTFLRTKEEANVFNTKTVCSTSDTKIYTSPPSAKGKMIFLMLLECLKVEECKVLPWSKRANDLLG